MVPATAREQAQVRGGCARTRSTADRRMRRAVRMFCWITWTTASTLTSMDQRLTARVVDRPSVVVGSGFLVEGTGVHSSAVIHGESVVVSGVHVQGTPGVLTAHACQQLLDHR